MLSILGRYKATQAMCGLHHLLHLFHQAVHRPGRSPARAMAADTTTGIMTVGITLTAVITFLILITALTPNHLNQTRRARTTGGCLLLMGDS